MCTRSYKANSSWMGNMEGFVLEVACYHTQATCVQCLPETIEACEFYLLGLRNMSIARYCTPDLI